MSGSMSKDTWSEWKTSEFSRTWPVPWKQRYQRSGKSVITRLLYSPHYMSSWLPWWRWPYTPYWWGRLWFINENWTSEIRNPLSPITACVVIMPCLLQYTFRPISHKTFENEYKANTIKLLILFSIFQWNLGCIMYVSLALPCEKKHQSNIIISFGFNIL